MAGTSCRACRLALGCDNIHLPESIIMTKRQKLQLEQSEKRQKINELLGLDELSDEQRGDLDTLTKRMQHIEVEMRAAIVVEGEEEAETRGMFGDGDGQSAELRSVARPP